MNNAIPPPPVFGMAGGTGQHAQAPSSRFINIDEIFADCFLDGDQDLLGLPPNPHRNSAGLVRRQGGQQQVVQPSQVTNQQQMVYGMPGQVIGHQAQVPLGVMPDHPPEQQQQQHTTMRVAGTTRGRASSSSSAMLKDEDDDRARKRPRAGGRNMTEQQKLDRRERNREHAKRSRVRKKFLLESLQKSVTALQEENKKLRQAIQENLGDEANELLSSSEHNTLLAAAPGDATKVLGDPDYSLVKALQTAQQNFVITDPTLPDNPIVFASLGFLTLTGYTLDQVLGRNCRMLQGPDTDPKAVEKIRKAIDAGVDTSVCLLNYRVNGTTFWNQFFIAALRDAEGKIINFVGVQSCVNKEFAESAKKEEDVDEYDSDE